ncbi:MAG: hypothetical protein ACKVX7_14590 [Planctomycetota bacterium]
MCSHSLAERRSRERGSVLVGVMIVLVVVLILADSMLSVQRVNARSASDSLTMLRADYLANAGLHAAFAEVAAQTDSTGNGLGAMGIATPLVFSDSNGQAVGEYRTYVKQDGTRNIIVALAAVPSFSNPLVVRSSQGVVQAETSFILAPKPSAVSISGPIVDPVFPGMSPNGFMIDGGEDPAFVFSSAAGYAAVMETLGNAVAAGTINGTELAGDVTSTYEHPTAGPIELPIIQQSSSLLSAAELNQYRTDLRDAVLALASSADRTITTRVLGNATWGTAGDPEVTVIEAGTIGKDRVFDTVGQTITGNGTLIIKHTTRPRKNLNLNWTGDIYVLGYDGDGGDLLYTFGTQGTINGNLVLLASDTTEASLEVMNSSSTYVPTGSRRPSNLTINGSVLCLAEANSHETELEVESSSSLTVNGLVAMFGSRIEIEASGATSNLTINGSLSVGMAQELAAVDRIDDFEIEATGNLNITYNESLVTSALAGLQALETGLDLGGEDSTVYDRFMISAATGLCGDASVLALAEFQQMLEELGSYANFGVDMDTVGTTQ